MRPVVRWRAVLLGIALGVCGCNGGGSDTSLNGGTTPPPGANNAVAIKVDGGPLNNYINGLFVTVTVCVHGTNTCKAVDHVLVDTGSFGLRLINSEVASLNLPALTTGSAVLGECVVFGDGSSLGTVSDVDVTIGAETASNLPVQIIGGPTTATSRPASCGSGPAEDTLAAFGARGVLGVGVLRYDCGAACEAAPGGISSNPGTYLACSSGSCQPIAWPRASQVQNPVYFLATDGNGVAIQLALPPGGVAGTWSGVMYFGVGTQSDNALPGSRTLLTTDSETGAVPGFIHAVYPAGSAAVFSVIDTGSNALFFPQVSGDPALCPSPANAFYCPSAPESFSATQVGNNGTSNAVLFTIGNAESLASAGNRAIVQLGGNLGSGFFDWGLPFFYGRKVFFAAEGQSTPAGTGPYIAY